MSVVPNQLTTAIRTRDARVLIADRRARDAKRGGFTLLELMLALALAAVVLVLVNTAIDLHLRSLDLRRNQLEEAQLARSVLRIIADDLRAVVQSYEQDVSSVEAMLQQAASSAAGQMAAQGGSSAGSGSGPTDPNATTDGSTPASADQSAVSDAAGIATTSSSTGGSTATGGVAGSSDGSTTSESQASGDLSTVTVPALPGIYGNQYQLQIDLSRLPRVEDYQRYLTEEAATSVVDIPSDVKTVTYYVKSPTAAFAPVPAATSDLSALDDPNANATGLIRRELDRAVTSNALESGNFAGLENSGELIAPEVVSIEFRYFNGTEWLLEWDTSVEQTLPLAVQVLVAMSIPQSSTAAAATANTDPAAPPVRIYSMVVRLPTGGQSSGSQSTGTATSTSTSSASTSTPGSTSTTGAAP